MALTLAPEQLSEEQDQRMRAKFDAAHIRLDGSLVEETFQTHATQ